MRSFTVPTKTQRGISDAFRQIRLAIQDLDAPLLSKKSSLKGIAEGSSAYLLEDKTLYRYTKMKSKLYKERVGDLDAPDSEIPYSTQY